MPGRKIPTSINTSYSESLDEECQEHRRLLNGGPPRLPPSPLGPKLVRPVGKYSAAQLSPLCQREPVIHGAEYANDAHQKSYDGSVMDELKLEAGDARRSPSGRRRPTSARCDADDEEWIDPGKGLGRMTLSCLVVAALGLLGLLMFMGKALDTLNGPEDGHAGRIPSAGLSAQSVLAAFPFSPAHYLQDCPSQPSKDGHDSTPPLTRQPTNNTYFQGALQNKTAYSDSGPDGKKICEKSLTYLLDDDYGFTFHLNAISLAAALAEKDSRAFFIVDAEWDRGTWSDHFSTLPDPGCAPPPPSEMAGCPRSTKHWILTSAIFSSHFSTEFDLNFGDQGSADEVSPAGIIPYSRQSIYEMARSTFLRLFVLSEPNGELIRKTKQQIVRSEIWGPSADSSLPPFVSVHVRKGDRHPHDPLHKFDYVPITHYIDSINSTWRRLRDADSALPESPNVYLASDTPLALEQMRALTPASWKFFHLSEAGSPEISQIAHPHEYSQRHFHAHLLSERVGYTRGQIIDMAFLAGGWPEKSEGPVSLSSTDLDKPLATICTVSSNMCQFAALQLGWSEAFDHSKWINLDLPLSAGWTGVEIPAPNTGDADPDGHGHGGAHHHH